MDAEPSLGLRVDASMGTKDIIQIIDTVEAHELPAPGKHSQESELDAVVACFLKSSSTP